MARLRAAQEHFAVRDVSVVALEIAGLDRTYGWERQTAATPFERLTVFDDQFYEDIDANELKRGIFQALDRLDPVAVAINGYAFRDSRTCLNWCISRNRKAILMSETTAADTSRYLLRETAKQVVLRRFAAAVCGGRLHRDYLITLGMSEFRIFQKYDVIDNDYFSPAPRSSPAGLSLPGLADSRPFFLAANRFIPRKNLNRLLTAYAEYRRKTKDGWRLVLLGGGEEENRLRKRVSAEEIADVTFAGFRQQEELREYYARAGSFIHPAISEPWGLVVNEAMAAGLPVIVSRRVGCAPDLVEHGKNGFTFDPYDSSELSALMAQLSSDETLQKRMAQRSLEIIGEWTPHEFAKSLWGAFRTPDDQYRIVTFGRRRLLAYREDSARNKLARVKAIQGFTLRRRFGLSVVRASIVAGLDRLWFRKIDFDNPKFVSADVRKVLDQICEHLKQQQLVYTFAWPSKPERQRTYAYAFDKANKACAFIKISEGNETPALENGFNTLRSLQQISHPLFKFPSALVFGTSGQVCYHVSECIPIRRSGRLRLLRSISPEDCVKSYSGEAAVIPPEQLQATSWIQGFWRSIDISSRFAELARKDLRMGAKCRRVHGDLTIANLIPDGQYIWIIDWELSHPMGPWMTDLITFFLGRRQRELVKQPGRVLRQFRRRFVEGQSEEIQRDARFAVMFLYGMKSGLGTALVNAWNVAE